MVNENRTRKFIFKFLEYYINNDLENFYPQTKIDGSIGFYVDTVVIWFNCKDCKFENSIGSIENYPSLCDFLNKKIKAYIRKDKLNKLIN